MIAVWNSAEARAGSKRLCPACGSASRSSPHRTPLRTLPRTLHPQALAACPDCQHGAGPGRCNLPADAARMYNQMVEPLTRVSVRGFLWWQGEAEVLMGIASYDCLFKVGAEGAASALPFGAKERAVGPLPPLSRALTCLPQRRRSSGTGGGGGRRWRRRTCCTSRPSPPPPARPSRRPASPAGPGLGLGQGARAGAGAGLGARCRRREGAWAGSSRSCLSSWSRTTAGGAPWAPPRGACADSETRRRLACHRYRRLPETRPDGTACFRRSTWLPELRLLQATALALPNTAMARCPAARALRARSPSPPRLTRAGCPSPALPLPLAGVSP